jgi:hypothetical protein
MPEGEGFRVVCQMMEWRMREKDVLVDGWRMREKGALVDGLWNDGWWLREKGVLVDKWSTRTEGEVCVSDGWWMMNKVEGKLVDGWWMMNEREGCISWWMMEWRMTTEGEGWVGWRMMEWGLREKGVFVERWRTTEVGLLYIKSKMEIIVGRIKLEDNYESIDDKLTDIHCFDWTKRPWNCETTTTWNDLWQITEL